MFFAPTGVLRAPNPVPFVIPGCAEGERTMITWVALALLIGAVGLTAWLIAKASKAGTGMLLAATAGFALLWIFGIVNLFTLATH
jgi:hypothetical protein